ncbi:MAG TPA: SpoIIE family protein phosphatase [Bacteroidota bacterium]|nr:SpoIIE family protein phosphatase [Bacteroidota bacterium]
MFRLKRLLYIGVPVLLLIIVFMIDVVRITVEFDVGGILYLRELAVIGALVLIYFFVSSGSRDRGKAATKDIGRLLVVVAGTTVLVGLVQVLPGLGFSEGGPTSVPLNSLTVFFGALASVGVSIASIVTLMTVRSLVFHKRKKGTKRNFIIYLAALIGCSILVLPFWADELSLVSTTFFVAAIVMIVVISFRQSWIVFLSRREKIYSIIYSAIVFIAFIVLSLLLTNRTFLNKSIVFFSSPAERFVLLNSICGAVYFGMAFISTLFHLPTAEVYERKQSELSSLHNLSRLVTQVFDFKDLVNTVTHMTREVCGAQSAWLEMIRDVKDKGYREYEAVGMNNISEDQIAVITAHGEYSLRKLVIESKKVLLVDEVATDRRTRHMKQYGIRFGSLLSVPLISHEQIIGILHATKDVEYGFDQDDIDVVTTFADHVTIAIENSRLIAQSLERERYRQEMMVARDMQRRLLPQKFPTSKSFEIAAMSEPAMEVGGDYFDFVELENGRVGVVVGDVSGKGVSAAFYMAEVKGIFQSLSKLCDSPRELLVRANHTLIGNLEKKAFISLLYVILDVKRATLELARAGHCPMIHISGNEKDMIRPSGLGLGLTNGEIFSNATEEKTILLKKGDLCLFYTDGITESRNEAGEEFGYERLVMLAAEIQNQSAREIQDRILTEIKAYCGKAAFGDDLTLVVMKWLGT